MDAGHARSKRPITAGLAGPYGHPFHPLLVSVPIGAWVASLAFDLAALVTTDPGPALFAARWLVGLGVLGGLAAACVGFLDFLGLPSGTPAKRTARLHAVINLTVLGIFAAGLAWRLSAPTASAHGGQLALSLVGAAGLTAGGWLGGKLAYRYGVRVADETTQAEGFAPEQAATRADRRIEG